jgi:hypothetical protein
LVELAAGVTQYPDGRTRTSAFPTGKPLLPTTCAEKPLVVVDPDPPARFSVQEKKTQLNSIDVICKSIRQLRIFIYPHPPAVHLEFSKLEKAED